MRVPYSPDFALFDFHAFRSLRYLLHGRQFKNDKELENGMRQQIEEKLAKDFFERGIRKTPKRRILIEIVVC